MRTNWLYKTAQIQKVFNNVGVNRLLSYIPKNRLDGKIAVVTASTKGIGFEIAKRLAQEGAKVIISSRKQTNVDDALSKLASDKLQAVGLTCHVANPDHRQKLIREAEKLGGIDILVSNAGVNPVPGAAIDCTESQWDKIFDTNLKSAFFLARDSMPLIRKRGGGTIIFTSSIAAVKSIKGLGIYSVSKAGVFTLTKILANELAAENVRVNCIAPGVIDTDFVQALLQMYPEKVSLIPMKRIGTPDEVSGVATFLASNDAKYITGEMILVTGGLHLY